MCTNFTGAWHGHHCDASIGLVCLDYGNPNPAPHGVTHFDNLVYAFITIFQCITMEGWASLMQSVIAGTSGWAFVYFFSLVRPAPSPNRSNRSPKVRVRIRASLTLTLWANLTHDHLG